MLQPTKPSLWPLKRLLWRVAEILKLSGLEKWSMSQLQYKHQAMWAEPTRQARNSSKLAAAHSTVVMWLTFVQIWTGYSQTREITVFFCKIWGVFLIAFQPGQPTGVVRRDTTHSHAQAGLSSLYENVLLRSFSYRECAVTTAAQTQPRGNVAVNKLLSGAPWKHQARAVQRLALVCETPTDL